MFNNQILSFFVKLAKFLKIPLIYFVDSEKNLSLLFALTHISWQIYGTLLCTNGHKKLLIMAENIISARKTIII